MGVWRTQTVVALCEAMREAHDYTALPILADALEEAGFTEEDFKGEDILGQMRAGSRDWIVGARLVSLVYSDETMYAVYEMDVMASESGTHTDREKSDIYHKELYKLLDQHRATRGGSRWDYHEEAAAELSARGITDGERPVNFHDLMEAGLEGSTPDGYWVQMGSEDLRSGVISISRFWHCWELISNYRTENHGNPFSCSC